MENKINAVHLVRDLACDRCGPNKYGENTPAGKVGTICTEREWLRSFGDGDEVKLNLKKQLTILYYCVENVDIRL